MIKPKLYIFSGLPASGQSTLAKLLAEQLNSVYLRIDSIEQTLRDTCDIESIYDQGYKVAYSIARDNLINMVSVVADSVNSLNITREEWESVAKKAHCQFINIEITCSNQAEHKERVEKRYCDVANLKLPTWQDVEERSYDDWTSERIIIDTAGESVDNSFTKLLSKVLSVSKDSHLNKHEIK